MVTKSKLFDIFDVIKDNELSFCVLCLRNQNETKLVKPQAFTLFMESFNYKFKNPMICYMCEAKAESALKFLSMVQFAATVEKIMQDIFSHYHKYHNTKQRMLELMSDAKRFKRTPFMADVCDCEEMVEVVRERTTLGRTDTLTLHACGEDLDTGQQPAACNSHSFPQRVPDLAPFSTGANLMDNIILFPAPTNGHGSKPKAHLAHFPNAVLYKNILTPSAERVAPGGPTPGVNMKEGHSNNFANLQNGAINDLHRSQNTNGPQLYIEDCIRRLLVEKTQNGATNESKRMRVGSAASNSYSSGGQMVDFRSGELAVVLRSGEQAAISSGGQAVSLRSGEQAAMRNGGQATSLRSAEQATRLRGGEQAAMRGGGQAASLRSEEQAASLRGGEQAASLRGGEQAPSSGNSEQTSKEAVMDPRTIDWEDKIPMDLISFVEGADQNNSPNLIYQPTSRKQMLQVDPPFTACITDVRSERDDKQDSDDDLIVVNNVTPCIEID